MPHSVPVSQLMHHRNRWPQLRADTPVKDAITVLRVLTRDHNLSHGRSTPLVLDERYNLLGVITLVRLLGSVRPLCDRADGPCDLGRATQPVGDIAIPFPAHVEKDDGILKALDLMVEHNIPLLPVMMDGRLLGLIQLSDIYDTVAHLLFDNDFPEDRGWIWNFLHR